MQELESKYSGYDWFHSVGKENNRDVIYVNYINVNVINTITENALVHFASYKTCKPNIIYIDLLGLDIETN